MVMIWPMQYQGDQRTGEMLQRARSADGHAAEAMRETHGQVSVDRAPHQALRLAYGQSSDETSPQ